MSRRQHNRVWAVSVSMCLLLAALAEAEKPPPPPPPPPEAFDLAVLLDSRRTSTVLAPLKEGMRVRVEESWNTLIRQDGELARARNAANLFPNPSLQAYVNRLGQSLLPVEVGSETFLTFKIIQDPVPYADALATGTVYLSSGLVSLLENESQLAFLLMHEAGHFLLAHHLQQVIDGERAERKEELIKIATSAVGVMLTRGLLGGGGGLESPMLDAMGGYYGYRSGRVVAAAYGRYRHRHFGKEVQVEADQFAAQVLLDKGFDAREAPVVMAKLKDVVRRSSAAVSLAFANTDDLAPRATRLRELVWGVPYRPVLDQVLSRGGFRMSSPRFSQLMAELKRDNGLLALESDLFAIAQVNLEEASALLTDDPMTMYGLGQLYRAVGRTPQEAAKAAGYFKSAIEFDEVRHRFPEVHLEYAVELLSREDPKLFPEVQKALKTYVVLYQRKTGGALPPEMVFVYDYLEMTGDPAWIAFDVTNISGSAPYQLTGDPALDVSPSSLEPAKPSTPEKPSVPARPSRPAGRPAGE